VTNFAKEVDWAPGISNVRIYNYGGSDHTQFHSRSIEAASMIIVRNSDDSIENAAYGYHSGADNLFQNYSPERHNMTTNLMSNAIWKALNQEISKRAKFAVIETIDGTTEVHLSNAEQMFKTFNNVTASVDTSSGNVNATFSADNPVLVLPAGQDFTRVRNIVANGTGIADNWDATRNARLQNMRVNLVGAVEIEPLTLVGTETEASLKPLGGNKGELTIQVTELYSYGGTIVFTETFDTINSVAGVYNVGGYDVEIVVEETSVDAFVTQLKGNQNNLTVTVTEFCNYGIVNVISETISINNNAAGVYNVGGYNVYVDTKGNDQIRACYIVEDKAVAQEVSEEVVEVAIETLEDEILDDAA